MSTQSQQASAEQAAEQRRRKRKERAAKSRAPEPKNIVSGAGQPLDPGVRRDLEEQLGHDLSRVRLHTGRDAAHLTELLGADAVAVGQDILFREDAFKPGTDEGRRLLAHELLHTVQNPHGLGTLRAGRELGAVSLPQQAIEREAESAAQDLVRQTGTPAETAEEVQQGQATPGWLRYATVDADRRRMEQLDPATLVDRLANGLLRSLRGDPEDRSGRVRLQLARMAPQVQDIVLDRLELRLPTPVLDRLLEAVEETERGPLPLDATPAPHAVPSEAQDMAEERERASEDAEREARERAETPDGGRHDARHDGRGKAAGDRREDRQRDESAASGGRGNASHDGNAGTSPEQTAAQDQAEAGARQQDRSEARQEDRGAADKEGTRNDEAGQRQDDAGPQDKEADDAGGPEDGAAQEAETQAAAEQQAQRTEGPVGSPDAGRNTAPAPAALDRGGAEPGEKSRTAGDVGSARAGGDPENEEDSDDEPLGLESEATEDDAGRPDAEADDESAAGQVSIADADLVGATDAAKNPGLIEERKKGTARTPSLPSSAGVPVPEPATDASGSGTSMDDTSDNADDTESRGDQDLLGLLSGAQDQGGSTDGGVGDIAPRGSEGPSGPLSEAGGKEWDQKQTEERSEDSDARRRDEEARTADEATPGGAPGPGETAASGQLDKAGEDARRQEAGTASSSSAAPGDTGSRAGGTGEQTAAAVRPGTGAGTAESQAKGTDKQTDGADKGSAAGGGDAAKTAGGAATTDQGTHAHQSAPAHEPTTVPGEQDVTEGRGPATTAGPRTGPEQVSTPGPVSAPELAPGKRPSPAPGRAESRDNAPKATSAPGAATAAAASGSRPTGARRQAARKAAGAARRGAGGGGGAGRGTAPAAARGGRAGGSGSAKAGKATPPPDVSNATPEAGLATAAGLKPYQMLETLKGVDGAVGRSVDKERTALRKAPPKTQRPSGSSRTVPGGPTAAAPGAYTNAKVARTEATPGKTPEITGEQKPEGKVPGADVPEPSWWDIGLTIGAQLFGKLLKDLLPLDDLIDSILGLPTKDEGLKNARVGDAPGLPLENDSDPQRTDEQGGKLDERKTELHQAGREDAARNMGEDQIYPDVPKETLTGKVPGGKKAAKGGAARSVSGGVPIESASAVAEHDRSPQIQAGFADGRQKMGQERQAKDKKAGDDRKQYDRDLQQEVTNNGKKQADARDKGRSDIADSRDKWRKEQDDKVAEIDDKKGKKYDKVRKDIGDKEEQTDKDVDKRTEDDNKKIEDQQTNAEQDAEKKQKDGKDDADNWIEEAIEKLKSFFEELKNAIKSIFEKARQAVTDVIDQFKQQVFKLIDDARNWVIDQINKFADELIALGDDLLADYPAMRDKWRNTINHARDWAVQKVNEAADALKEVAGKLLDGLCDALVAGLDVLESGLLSAVDSVESVAVGALEFGAAAVAALGEWAAIFSDIVSDPGDWISKAGAAAETGAKEHLFNEIKAAVKEWFNQKVQEIIGIPIEDFQALIEGGVSIDEMAKMAWDDAVPQLPVIIGVLVVEKVVAKLIPGAGWVMAVIDALQTAWGTLSEILAAFGLFMDFLKAVKSGNGALPFAKAVAAGVVALLELVYQYLIDGIGRFMGKVAERLAGMLKNILGKKRPGGRGAPDHPDSPNKPKADKPKDEHPRDDKEKRDDDRAPDSDRTPAPRKPSADRTSRPQSKPRPGKRSSPEKKPRPSHTTRPKKRRHDDERREEGREVNEARRRARDAERRMRDDDRADAPTRRGPARDTAKPDRHRPDRDRKDDPKGNRRHDDDRSPDHRRDRDKGDDRTRKTDETKDRSRNRDKDTKRRRVQRARQTIKSAVNRARRAARNLFGKARRKVGGRLNDRLRRLRDQWRRRHDRNRPRDRDRDRDRPGQQEGRKDYDLPSVRFRTVDGSLHTLLFDGKGKSANLAMRSTLETIKTYIADWKRENNSSPISEDQTLHSTQETAREQADTLREQVEKAQNLLLDRETGSGRYTRRTGRSSYGEPVFLGGDQAGIERQLRALRVAMEYLASALEKRSRGAGEPPLPDTILPAFSDGDTAESYKAHYIKKSTPLGTESGERENAWPLGWDRVVAAGLSNRGDWVRMHMLTAVLGGHSSTSNLAPARRADNIDAREKAEHPAARAIGKKPGGTGQLQKMIWYDADITMWGTHPGFPSSVNMYWGSYEYPNGHWQRKNHPDGSWTTGNFAQPPWPASGNSPLRINLNQADHNQIIAATRKRLNAATAKRIVNLRDQQPGKRFNGMTDLEAKLKAHASGPAGLAAAVRVINALKDAEQHQRLYV
ncbi:eCIS core domain-containing protein [Streptomyces sp. NPDC002520]